MKAQQVPYSSVVGGSVMLLADDGHCIGQIAFLVHDREALGGKMVQEDLTGRIVRLINEGRDIPKPHTPGVEAVEASPVVHPQLTPEIIVAELRRMHDAEMMGRGRDPARYISRFGLAADILEKREALGGSQADR